MAAPIPINCTIQVTLLRSCRQGPARAGKNCLLAAGRKDVWQALSKVGSANMLYQCHARGGVPGRGAVDFIGRENRPAIYLGGAGATNVSHAYGAEIHLRVYPAGGGDGPRLFVLDWDGSWAGSPKFDGQMGITGPARFSTPPARFQALAIRRPKKTRTVSSTRATARTSAAFSKRSPKTSRPEVAD